MFAVYGIQQSGSTDAWEHSPDCHWVKSLMLRAGASQSVKGISGGSRLREEPSDSLVSSRPNPEFPVIPFLVGRSCDDSR